jgi:hypothetical protein
MRRMSGRVLQTEILLFHTILLCKPKDAVPWSEQKWWGISVRFPDAFVTIFQTSLTFIFIN